MSRGGPVILVTSRSFGTGTVDLEQRLCDYGYRVVRAAPTHELSDLRAPLREAVAWIAGTGIVSRAHLEHAPRLRVLARYGVGTDAVDLDAAQQHGVIVANTPGANSTAVIELTLGLMLASLRGIVAGNTRVRQGRWDGHRGRELGALAVGVVGLGRIGRGVAERLTTLGCRVLGADPYLPGDATIFGTVERATTSDLARECDVLTLHAPGGTPIVDQQWLAEGERPVTIVNTARADLVDERAVAAGLDSGRVAAYAADTVSLENTSGHSPLLADHLSDRVIITPHIGAQTVEGIDTMGLMAVENVLAVLDGRPAPHRVRAA